MDPTGGRGLSILLVFVVLGILAWIFLPAAWAIGISIGFGFLFFTSIFYALQMPGSSNKELAP